MPYCAAAHTLLLLLLLLQDVLWWVLYKAESVLLGSRLRKWSLDEVGVHVHVQGQAPSYMAGIHVVIDTPYDAVTSNFHAGIHECRHEQ